MIFYEKETFIGLILASLPAILSIYFFFILEKKRVALFLLLSSAFLVRILMISIDPYVHEWDERFHALVAKNMISDPFKPMMFVKHIMAYDYADWGYNHIWVHKQPLFVWQMALSMKLFGINTFALRLPSAIMGTIMIWLIYDISRKWILEDKVAFIAAFMAAFANYALELTSGWISLDHNDMAFVFYMTCSFWAFTKYTSSDHSIKWAILIGIFSGLAILNKWLVGLLIFGGWGLYLLYSEYRLEVKKYAHLGIGVIVSGIVFIPWQLYILKVFPLEAAIAYEGNRKHMTEDLGHPGNAFFHLNFLSTAYHPVLVGLLVIGLIWIFKTKNANRKLTIPFLAMIVVIFSFFSLFVATKMPAFVYPVSSLLFVIMSFGAYSLCSTVFNYLQLIPQHRNQLLAIVTLLVGFYSFKPAAIAELRGEGNSLRNNKLVNSRVFKELDETTTSNYVVLNCRPYENIELMFYRNCTAYHWYPPENILDSLQTAGHKFAAFQYINDQQQLPEYITNDKEIVILNQGLK